MTLVNLIESLLTQLKNNKVDLIEGVVLSDGNNCILQLTMNGTDIRITKDPIIDILDANYKDRYDLNIDNQASVIEMQLSVQI